MVRAPQSDEYTAINAVKTARPTTVSDTEVCRAALSVHVQPFMSSLQMPNPGFRTGCNLHRQAVSWSARYILQYCACNKLPQRSDTGIGPQMG